MTCRECKNYKECNKQEKIKFELYDDGWLDEPYLCTYVESICQRFEKKRKCACCHSRKTAVTMSHIVGYDERKIREFQQKERESKGGAK